MKNDTRTHIHEAIELTKDATYALKNNGPDYWETVVLVLEDAITNVKAAIKIDNKR